jgi:ferredoxin
MADFSENKISGLTIRIDRTTCIATANCIKAAPEVFKLDDEKISSFIEPLTEIERERIIEACSLCPVDALQVFDEDNKQIVP